MKKKIVIAAAVVVLIILAVMFGKSEGYADADKNTRSLTSYAVTLNTIVTMTDGGGVRESDITQQVFTLNKGKDDMIYEVLTDAVNTDENGVVSSSSNSYLYYNDTYYYTYPGLKYKSHADSDAAENNVTNLVNIITFDEKKMKNLKKTKADGAVIYEYEVEFDDVSNHVKATIENAVNTFDGGNFTMEGVRACAIAEGKYITKRELHVIYGDGNGNSVVVDIFEELNDTETSVLKPNEEEYKSLIN